MLWIFVRFSQTKDRYDMLHPTRASLWTRQSFVIKAALSSSSARSKEFASLPPSARGAELTSVPPIQALRPTGVQLGLWPTSSATPPPETATLSVYSTPYAPGNRKK